MKQKDKMGNSFRKNKGRETPTNQDYENMQTGSHFCGKGKFSTYCSLFEFNIPENAKSTCAHQPWPILPFGRTVSAVNLPSGHSRVNEKIFFPLSWRKAAWESHPSCTWAKPVETEVLFIPFTGRNMPHSHGRNANLSLPRPQGMQVFTESTLSILIKMS